MEKIMRTLYNAIMNTKILKGIPKEITIKPAVRFGKPVVENTRIAIADILLLLKAGYTVEDLTEQYPHLTKAGILAVID